MEKRIFENIENKRSKNLKGNKMWGKGEIRMCICKNIVVFWKKKYGDFKQEKGYRYEVILSI